METLLRVLSLTAAKLLQLSGLTHTGTGLSGTGLRSRRMEEKALEVYGE